MWARWVSRSSSAAVSFSSPKIGVQQEAVNRPFAGAMVPAAHFRRDDRVLATMIEVNRALYMDELNGVRLPEFKQVASRIQGLVREMVRQSACGQ